MPRLTPLALALPLLLVMSGVAPAQNVVPNYNVEPSCKGGLSSPGLNERYSRCLQEEADAKKKLEATWASYPAGDRSTCGTTSRMGTPSYVELLTCLELAREAAKLKIKN